MKNDYRETELGILPNDWEVEEFVECITKEKIKVGKIKKQQFKSAGKFPIIDQGQSHIAGYSDIEDKVYKGDLPIIIFGDHTRIVKYIDFPFICGADGTKIITTKKSINPLFFYYFLSSVKIQSKGYNRHYHLLKELKIPLPPLPEQQKIAFTLSTIQKSKEKTERLINSLKQLKKSTMKHLFTYGDVSLENAKNVKLKETEIGKIPKDWEVVKVSRLTEKTKQNDMRKTNIEFKYIDVSGISRDTLSIVDYSTFKGKNAPSRARKIVIKNDIIIATVRPTLKRIAIVKEEFNNQICSTAFCVLRCNIKELNYLYLYYAIQRELFIENLGKIQTGASYPAITDMDVKNQQIPLPPLPIQTQIASILSTIDLKIEKEENKKKSLNILFKSMLHNLMSAKIRVNNLEVGD